MNKVKQFMNKITEKTNGAQGSQDGASTPTFVDGDEQHSAEGFLCPFCMTAFSSPEVLAEHYQKEHEQQQRVIIDEDNASLDPSMQSVTGSDADRDVVQLQSALDDERRRVGELQREIIRLEDEVRLRAEQSTKFRHNDELITAETEKLKKRLSTEIDQVGQLKLEKEILTRNISVYSAQLEQQNEKIKDLELAISECKSVEESNGPQMEALGHEIDKLKLTLEEERKANQKSFEELRSTNKTLTETLASRTLDLDKQISKNLEVEEESKKNTSIIEDLKRELSDSNKKVQMSEQSGAQLKADLAQLREQHSELLGKFEAGEDGNQTALDALTKESKTLRETLQALQGQFQEVSVNYANLQSQYDKSVAECKTLSSTNSNLELSVQKIQDQLKEVSENSTALKAELAASLENCKKLTESKTNVEHIKTALEEDLKSKSQALNNLKAKCVKSEEECQKLSSALESATSSVTSMTEELNLRKDELVKLKASDEAHIQQQKQIVAERELREKELSEKLSKAEENMLSVQKRLKAAEEQEVAKENQLSQLRLQSQSDLDALNTKLKEAESREKSLKEKLDAGKEEISKRDKQLLETDKSLKALETSLKEKTEKYDALVLLMQSEKETHDAEVAKLEREKENQNAELQKRLDDLGTEKQELKTKAEHLESAAAEAEALRADKIELEKKYKASEEGKSLLLERCLQGEANSDKMGETIADLRRKLDDSQSALKELGRENQSLQVESAKLQGRKWADDSVVTSCSTCSKDFSLTIRKHHCRQCGNIFCNDCTARTASIPSSKKPVRVCDACYEELSSK